MQSLFDSTFANFVGKDNARQKIHMDPINLINNNKYDMTH